MIIEVVRNLNSCRSTLKKGKPGLEWDLNPMTMQDCERRLFQSHLITSYLAAYHLPGGYIAQSV